MGQSWSVKINKNLKADVKKNAARGLALAAEHLLQVATDNCPIEEGTLIRSHVASVDEGALKAAVSADTPYAVPVHENMTARHDAGRSAKWLESAFNSESATVGKIIAKEIKSG
jgi:hypothetical protein